MRIAAHRCGKRRWAPENRGKKGDRLIFVEKLPVPLLVQPGIVHGVLWRSAADAAESLGANTSAMAINSVNSRIVGSALVGDEMRAAIWDHRSTNLTNTDAVLSTGAPDFTPLAGSSRAYAMSQGEFNVAVGLFEGKAFVAVPVIP